MSDRDRIPAVQVGSGEKFINDRGITAIKDGIKASGFVRQRLEKPDWLRIRMRGGATFEKVQEIVHEHRLATVCEEAKCPNISECWSSGTATIMLMGDVCTRACRFCSVNTGNPKGWLDAAEPEHAARSVQLMKLKYVVLTSVNRDDLPDGGAGHYAACVRRVRELNPETAVEALTPDFLGVPGDVETVLDSGIAVFAQNIETVRRLTHPVRDPRAGYQQTLAVLAHAKTYRPDVLTKTSLMLGLGETDVEIMACMDDLRAANVDILTLGQYLQVVHTRHDLHVGLTQPQHEAGFGQHVGTVRLGVGEHRKSLLVTGARIAHRMGQAADRFDILREDRDAGIQYGLDIARHAEEVRRQRLYRSLWVELPDAPHTGGIMPCPPSGRSSRLTEVRTTYFSFISCTERAACSGSAASSQPFGLPVLTEQKRQARVHTSPISMMVAVPELQHSLMLGHLASSHTVASLCSCTISCTFSNVAPPRMRIRNQSGFSRRWRTKPEALIPSLMAVMPRSLMNFSPLPTCTGMRSRSDIDPVPGPGWKCGM